MRLRLSRKKGFDLRRESRAANGREAASVARPGRWGNPYALGPGRTAERAVRQFRAALLAGKLAYDVEEVRARLGGRNLACWCAAGAPCHADVLLEIANG